MRITHLVCTDAFAGVEQYVAYVGRQQAADGHTVTVLGGSPADMRAAIANPEVTWLPAASVLAAQRALVRTPADLVHVHMTAAEIAAVSTKLLHRQPIVATLHFAQPRGAGRRQAPVYRAMGRFLDAQIAISAFVAERSEVEPEVILNGVPWDIPPRNRRPVVFMAQRLEREKDTATALNAWALAGLWAKGWTLDIAGAGIERERLIALSRELDIEDSVTWLGFVTDAKQRMTEAGIFLASAPEEPFGLSVVEAMASGTPVAAAAGGAHLETVGLVGTEWLFPPGSVEGCAAVLDKLVGDAERRADYGRALHQRWANSFTVAQHCSRLDDVYERVMQVTGTRHASR